MTHFRDSASNNKIWIYILWSKSWRQVIFNANIWWKYKNVVTLLNSENTKGKKNLFYIHDNIIQGQVYWTQRNWPCYNVMETLHNWEQFGVKSRVRNISKQTERRSQKLNFMFRRDHVILSFQNSQTLQFFLFLSLFVLFKQFLRPCFGPFYTKSRDLNCGLSFPSIHDIDMLDFEKLLF